MPHKKLLERVLNDFSTVKLNTNSSYHLSYPEFLKYFQEFDTLDRHRLTIGIHFTYGWMPTAFGFGAGDMDEILVILNESRKSGSIETPKLNIIKKYFNGSMVGTSKLLHFQSPTVFPIWDSRVYRYYYREEPHFYRIDNPGKYQEYAKVCRQVSEQPEFDIVHQHIISQLYPVSRIRSLELIMFEKGVKTHNQPFNGE